MFGCAGLGYSGRLRVASCRDMPETALIYSCGAAGLGVVTSLPQKARRMP